MAEVTHTALKEVTNNAHSRSAVKQNLERYINENRWQTGPGQLETLVIFNCMRDTLSKTLVVRHNLKKLHKVKAELGAAMTMFNNIHH